MVTCSSADTFTIKFFFVALGAQGKAGNQREKGQGDDKGWKVAENVAGVFPCVVP